MAKKKVKTKRRTLGDVAKDLQKSQAYSNKNIKAKAKRIAKYAKENKLETAAALIMLHPAARVAGAAGKAAYKGYKALKKASKVAGKKVDVKVRRGLGKKVGGKDYYKTEAQAKKALKGTGRTGKVRSEVVSETVPGKVKTVLKKKKVSVKVKGKTQKYKVGPNKGKVKQKTVQERVTTQGKESTRKVTRYRIDPGYRGKGGVIRNPYATGGVGTTIYGVSQYRKDDTIKKKKSESTTPSKKKTKDGGTTTPRKTYKSVESNYTRTRDDRGTRVTSSTPRANTRSQRKYSPGTSGGDRPATRSSGIPGMMEMVNKQRRIRGKGGPMGGRKRGY